MKEIDIVCLKHGEVYDWSWVDKLYNGVSRSFTPKINFHVLTDKIDTSKPYNQILLPDFGDIKGYEQSAGAWWYKVWLFSDEHPLQKQFIYFDLDMIFTGNCDFLLDCPEDKFGTILDWQVQLSNKSKFMINSSLMVMNPTKYHYVWEKYKSNRKEIQEIHHGDQDFVARVIDRSTIHEFDNQNKILSYAFSLRHGGVKTMTTKQVSRFKGIHNIVFNNPEVDYILPEDARIVVCNGHKYKPNTMTHLKFIQDYWI